MVKLDAYNNFNSITHTHTHTMDSSTVKSCNSAEHGPAFPTLAPRSGKRLWTAASGRLRESRSVLSCWTTGSSGSRFRVSLAGKGSVAWAEHGIISAIDVVIRGNMFNWLEKTGKFSSRVYVNVLLHFVSSVIGLIYAVVLIINATGINGSWTNIRGHNSSGSWKGFSMKKPQHYFLCPPI